MDPLFPYTPLVRSSRAHDGREAYARLLTALRELPRRHREAFTLRVLEEFDVADSARIMKCSEGSVKTPLSCARAALQRPHEDFAGTTTTPPQATTPRRGRCTTINGRYLGRYR